MCAKNFEDTDYPNILQEADNLTSHDRQDSYGHPLDDFKRVADLINALFYDRFITGKHFRASDIPLIMICVKLSREINKHKRDNLVDIAGYARTLEMVYERLPKE